MYYIRDELVLNKYDLVWFIPHDCGKNFILWSVNWKMIHGMKCPDIYKINSPGGDQESWSRMLTLSDWTLICLHRAYNCWNPETTLLHNFHFRSNLIRSDWMNCLIAFSNGPHQNFKDLVGPLISYFNNSKLYNITKLDWKILYTLYKLIWYKFLWKDKYTVSYSL